MARKVGIYQLSSKKAGACRAVPYSPSTKAKLKDVNTVEDNLNTKQMIEKSLESIKVIEI